MPRSAFELSSGGVGVTTSAGAMDETYDLRGLNLTDPNQIMPPGETPFTINSRMYATNDGEAQVANRTRKGASLLSTPIGETADTANTATGTGDLAITTTKSVAQKIVATATGRLTLLQPHIKKAAGSYGHIIVEIYSNSSGFPGTLLAQGSILDSNITTSYQYLNARFIEAPVWTATTAYWAVYYVQDNGSGEYYLDQTAIVGTAAKSSLNDGQSWTTLAVETRYKSYVSTAKPIWGWHTYYPSVSSNKRILIAQNGNIYSIVKATGVATDIGNCQDGVPVRFGQVNDKAIIVDQTNLAQWWDGTVMANMANVPSSAPLNVIVWNNRVFFQTTPTRVDFSGLGDYESYRSVDFFYVPEPKSADVMTGWVVFHDDLTIFTHETKHQVIGTNLSNFTRRQAVGTKGAVSQEAIVADRDYIYFMADDKTIYKWNGGDDIPISTKMEPEFQGIADPSKVRLELYRNQLRVYYDKGNGYNNRMALLDLRYNQWFLDTDHPVVGSGELSLDNNELIEFSSLVGAIYYGETQYSDLGRRIDWEYRTNYKTYGYRRRTGQSFGGGATKKRIKRFRPVLETADSNYTMLIGKDMDYANNPDMREYVVAGNGATYGSGVKYGDGTRYGGTKLVYNKSPMSGRGRHIQYRFARSGVETPVFLLGYISQYKTGQPK